MAVNYSAVTERVFNLLKGYGYSVKAYNSEGKQEIDPQKSVRFAVSDPNILVRVDQTTETLRLSTGMDDEDDLLRKQLKEVADDFLLNFDFRKFNRKLAAKSEQIDIDQKSETDMADVMEGFGTMTGTTKTSYQPLDNIKIVVKHKSAVNEESRGSRSRNIHNIFIQRGEERFKMAENNLKAARAMARHLQMGGEVFDNVGNAITEMAQEQRKLKEFVQYVRKNNLISEDNSEYVNLAIENLDSIKQTLNRLSGAKTYSTTVESVLDRNNVEVLEDDIDLETKFIETHFDDKVANAMDSIKKGLYRQKAYRESIELAIENEDFSNLKNVLSENDTLDFVTPQAKLSHQVSQLGNSVQSDLLRNHLQGISKKLSTGGSLDHFDYTTVKSCLLSVNQPKVKASMAESVADKYAEFIDSFDIL